MRNTRLPHCQSPLLYFGNKIGIPFGLIQQIYINSYRTHARTIPISPEDQIKLFSSTQNISLLNTMVQAVAKKNQPFKVFYVSNRNR
jgi:hypothetical protein